MMILNSINNSRRAAEIRFWIYFCRLYVLYFLIGYFCLTGLLLTHYSFSRSVLVGFLMCMCVCVCSKERKGVSFKFLACLFSKGRKIEYGLVGEKDGML